MHFDQLMTENGIKNIEKITGAIADREFPEKKINRTRLEGKTLKGSYLSTYSELCSLAGFKYPD